MSKIVNVGYTDTPISGVTVENFPRGLVNYGADFRIKQDIPNEVILTNLTSPVDRPERFRFSYSDVANIYNGTDVDPSMYAPSKKGVSILTQVTEVLSVTDTTDAAYRVDLPVSAHLVLKIPANENITAVMLETILGRLVSGVYETGSLTTERLASMFRGSLTPADL